MNMFAAMTGDKERERQRELFFLERLRDNPDIYVERMTASSQCIDCGEPMVNCFCFFNTVRSRKKKR